MAKFFWVDLQYGGPTTRRPPGAGQYDDGAADVTFDPSPSSAINCIAFQPDNDFVGGSFTSIGGLARTNFARLTLMDRWTRPASIQLNAALNTVVQADGRS
jgi:hypothetical protein